MRLGDVVGVFALMKSCIKEVVMRADCDRRIGGRMGRIQMKRNIGSRVGRFGCPGCVLGDGEGMGPSRSVQQKSQSKVCEQAGRLRVSAAPRAVERPLEGVA